MADEVRLLGRFSQKGFGFGSSKLLTPIKLRSSDSNSLKIGTLPTEGKTHEAPVNQAEVAICAATASVLGKDGGLWGAPRIWSQSSHCQGWCSWAKDSRAKCGFQDKSIKIWLSLFYAKQWSLWTHDVMIVVTHWCNDSQTLRYNEKPDINQGRLAESHQEMALDLLTCEIWKSHYIQFLSLPCEEQRDWVQSIEKWSDIADVSFLETTFGVGTRPSSAAIAKMFRNHADKRWFLCKAKW